MPNEFWPHHGSLSKQIRSATEAALKRGDQPATAICTNTLELGMDIGAVKSVVQIGPSPCVASLRQRLGRSVGERVTRHPSGVLIEDAITPESTLSVQLRLDTLRMAAMISLLLEGWFEPPITRGLHLSTLVQQLLSVISQFGGVTATRSFALLCGPGAPFEGISQDEYAEMLKHLGNKELLMQDSSGLLLHGRVGEKFVNHYTFYAAFASDEEYRIETAGMLLGSLPISQTLILGQHVIFAGMTWTVDEVNEEQKTILVSRARGGSPPLFSGGGGRTHSVVRRRMRQLLSSQTELSFLDETARRFLDDGRKAYARLGLDEKVVLDSGPQMTVLTWLGDAANEAMTCLLMMRGITAWPSRQAWRSARREPTPTKSSPFSRMWRLTVFHRSVSYWKVRLTSRERSGIGFPKSLLQKAYASLYLDIDEAVEWIRGHFHNRNHR